MIGIIGAMQEEVDALLKYMQIVKTVNQVSYTFYVGHINDIEVVVVKGGIGKVNASISTTVLLKSFTISKIINIGSAGGLKEYQRQGDIIISNNVVHHDVDNRGFSYGIGQVPGMPLYYQADEKMMNTAEKIAEENTLRFETGLIASGDSFIYRKDQVEQITTNFDEALCTDMEASSIAQVCFVFTIPFIIIRALSDVFEQGESNLQFKEFIKLASERSAALCVNVIKVL